MSSIYQQASIRFFAFTTGTTFVRLAVAAEVADAGDAGFIATLTGAVWEAVFAVCAIIFVVIMSKSHNRGRSARRVDKLGYSRDAAAADCHISRQSAKPKEKKALPGAVVAEDKPEVKDSPEQQKMTDQMNLFARRVDVANVQKVLLQIEETFGQKKVSANDYTVAITTCAKANEPVAAHAWLRRLTGAGLKSNAVGFNAVINAYAKAGDLPKALLVASEMQDMGLEYDTITYNILIDAWTRAHDAANAQFWMTRMINSGVKPSVVSFGSVMRACAQGGLAEDLEYWFKQAGTFGIVLNMICFSAIINGFAKAGDLDSATTWLVRMLEYGLSPTAQCFSGLLSSLINKGDIDGAVTVTRQMRLANVTLDAVTYSSLVKGAAHAGNKQAAQMWADEAAASGLTLMKPAEAVLLAAGLRVPVAAELMQTEVTDAAEETSLGFSRSKERKACVGQQFVGVVREFIPGKFGYITCEKIHNVFRRDVFLSCQENPDQLSKGQRVSFMLQIDRQRGLPRAANVQVSHNSQSEQ